MKIRLKVNGKETCIYRYTYRYYYNIMLGLILSTVNHFYYKFEDIRWINIAYKSHLFLFFYLFKIFLNLIAAYNIR